MYFDTPTHSIRMSDLLVEEGENDKALTENNVTLKYLLNLSSMLNISQIGCRKAVVLLRINIP